MNDELPRKAVEVYWAEIAPCEHVVQFYESDSAFLDSLEGFAYGGMRAGEGVIVIATPSHIEALEDRLTARGIDVAAARLRDRFIPLDAEQTISTFMVDGWPDDSLFTTLVTELIARARKNGGAVRAFGEMVALMWAQGHHGGTVRLEHLWHGLCRTEAFSLFCAYPKSGFTRDATESIREICAAHSEVFAV